MKKIFLVLLVFLPGLLKAQIFRDSGFVAKGLQAESILKIPLDTLPHKTGIAEKDGMLYFGNGIYWKRLDTTIVPTAILTASNGLTASGTNVKFGGTLIDNNTFLDIPNSKYFFIRKDGIYVCNFEDYITSLVAPSSNSSIRGTLELGSENALLKGFIATLSGSETYLSADTLRILNSTGLASYPVLSEIIKPRNRILLVNEISGVVSRSEILPDYADNAAAVAAGLAIGEVYRTGDFLKIVH